MTLPKKYAKKQTKDDSMGVYTGCSSSAWRSLMRTLSASSWTRPRRGGKKASPLGESQPVIGAVDETCLQRMILVLMELATGHWLREEISADRRYEAWFERANTRLSAFGAEALHLLRFTISATGLGPWDLRELF